MGMLTVATLLVVAYAVKTTGAIEPIKNLLGGSKNGVQEPLGLVIVRFMLPISMLSAFMNNTPVSVFISH